MADSHAVLAEEIVRLRQKNKKLCEALELSKIASGTHSPNDYKKWVDKQLAELKEE